MAAGVAEIYFGIPVWEEKTCTRKMNFSGFHGAKVRFR